MKDTIFVKYSNERDDRFKIKTIILRDNEGNYHVEKHALTEEAQKHVVQIAEYGKQLNDCAKGTKFRYNETSVKDGILNCTYVEGEPLSVILHRKVIEKDFGGAMTIVQDYCSEIKKMAIVPFAVTDDFRAIFGNVSFNSEQKSCLITDIDMIFSNIIISGDNWNVLDYEWTYNFPIPVKFVIFRAILAAGETVGVFLRKNLSQLGINEDEFCKFMEMEERFQMYVKGSENQLNDFKSMQQRAELVSTTGIEAAALEAERKLQETERKLQEAERKLQEAERKLQEAENRIQELEIRNKAAAQEYAKIQSENNTLEAINRNLTYSHNKLEYILESRGWRVLCKYYAIRDKLFPRKSALREFAKKIARQLLGQNQNRAWCEPRTVVPQRDSSGVRTIEGFDLISKCRRIDILSVPHTAYIAKLLQGILREAGLECETHLSEPEVYEDIPYIMICPQNFKRFPDVYIAFQMEQTINPRWLTDEYMTILHNAYAVFDYSLENIAFFNKDPKLASKLYYLPVDVCQSMMQDDYCVEKKKYDVLFYGAPFVENRQRYLKPIGEKYNLRIVSEQFGPELYCEMNKAKILINIHYYENALLETTRLYESLSVSDCLIISERSGDPREEAALEGIVDFVEAGNVEAMMERIEYWLSHEEERAEKVAKNREILKNRISAAKFYLYRFLLANDRIVFDRFYEDVGAYIHFNTDRVCLSLPESTERRAAFDADNVYGFEVFPGLKHRLGWIGCGMSYKFMLRKAMEQKMERILICEDDVYFPSDFQKRFDHVLKYTEENNDWNVFSGIMADIGRVKPLKYAQDEGEEFIYLDKMISMVFNLYDKSMFEIISAWDNMNRDVQKNTIDRYLEDKKLRILATCPFLVGHKEDLHSTIWGQQNSIYTELISNSSIKLQKLVADFKKQMNIDN